MRYVSPQCLGMTWVPRVLRTQARGWFWRARPWCKEIATWGWSCSLQLAPLKETITDDWAWRRTCRGGYQITCYLATVSGFRVFRSGSSDPKGEALVANTRHAQADAQMRLRRVIPHEAYTKIDFLRARGETVHLFTS